jgi:hypothetical protein
LKNACIRALLLGPLCVWPVIGYAQLGPAPGLSPSNLGTATIIPSGATAARALSSKLGDMPSVRDFGAVGDGVTDDTAAINAAAAAIPAGGGTLLLTRGNYLVDGISVYNAILLHSNTAMRCDGATITAGGPNANSLALVQNAGNAARVLTDHDISVEGCTFVYPNWQVGAVGKAVQFWFASHVSVRNSVIYGGANLTAMIGSSDTEVSGNCAYGVTNAAYDNFFGGGRHRILNNYAEVADNPTINSWGIQVTGQDIANNPTPIDDVQIENNTIYYAGTAGAPIGAEAVPGGNLTHLTIANNHLYVTAPGGPMPGIYLNTPGNGFIVADNMLDGSQVQPAIFVQAVYGTPTGLVISGNTLTNCGHGSGYAGNIQVTATGSTITGNHEIACTGAMVSVSGANTTIGLNDDGTGPTGSALATGALSAASGSIGALGAAGIIAGSVSATAIGAPAGGVGSITPTNGGVFWTPPTLTLAPPPGAGIQATASPSTFGLSTASAGAQAVTSPGRSYTAGEALNVAGGTLTPGGTAAYAVIDSVNATDGHPTAIHAGGAGSYAVLPADPATFTAANGSGFVAHLSWFIGSVQVTNPGSGYTSPPAVTSTGCSGTGGFNTGCGTFTAALAPAFVSYGGVPSCSVATAGSLCNNGTSVQVR